MQLKSGPPIDLPAEAPPQLLVVIDTEEEFDWNKPVDRQSTSVEAMQYIGQVQDIFDEYDITPCYVIDYPVASQFEGYTLLKQFQQNGRCEIGAHLHPWVNPPLDEDLIPANTYPGNLAKELELAKLKVLTDQITESFGKAPNIYKAGRYGFGKNTSSILTQLGYQIDLSYSPAFNHGGDGGPDYRFVHSQPFWLNDEKTLFEIPITGAYTGIAGKASRVLYDFAQAGKKFKLPAIFSRSGIVDRLVLSPEGYTSQEHVKLTRELYGQGVRSFTWSFHSPTVMPGTTDYVRNDQDVKKFLDSFRYYFDFFFNKMNGVATTPSKLKSQLESL